MFDHKPRPITGQLDGWVGPDGAFYAVTPGSHDNFSYFMFHCSVTTLEKKGWAHISGGIIVNEKIYMTQAQYDALWDWIMIDPQQECAALMLELYFKE